MTNRIWITRTVPAERSATAWAAAGFEPHVASLLNVIPLGPANEISNDAELIFTSAHGVRHSGLLGDGRRVYTVGEATAATAREVGFSNVISSMGDWRALLEIIKPTAHPIIHIHGETVRGNIVETLLAQGMEAHHRIVYKTETMKAWPFDPSGFDAVALYSPKASETLMSLATRDLDHITAYCLSKNVAEPLKGIDVRVAKTPTEEALIACSRVS